MERTRANHLRDLIAINQVDCLPQSLPLVVPALQVFETLGRMGRVNGARRPRFRNPPAASKNALAGNGLFGLAA